MTDAPRRRLLVIRHAKSAWDRPGLDDFDRPLAPRGRRAAAALGVYLRDEGLAPDLVLCSGARRAHDTWIWIQRQLDGEAALRLEPALYMAPSETIRALVSDADDAAATLAVIGHEGSVDLFARRLARVGEPAALRRLAEAFPTAALAVLALDLAHWRDVGASVARLERFVRPKDLM